MLGTKVEFAWFWLVTDAEQLYVYVCFCKSMFVGRKSRYNITGLLNYGQLSVELYSKYINVVSLNFSATLTVFIDKSHGTRHVLEVEYLWNNW